MSILVIDYGMGNIGSVKRSLEECGASVLISSDPNDVELATHIILPGVGSFPDGMRNLHRGGWFSQIRKAVLEDKIPILGICLGMQLLAERGYENQETVGLGLIKGEVIRLEKSFPDERIPHVGWNEVVQKQKKSLFDKIPDHADFYFVHSYHLVPSDPQAVLSLTPYCGEFISSVHYKNIYGVQFHPEKSSYYGMLLLRNFISIGPASC